MEQLRDGAELALRSARRLAAAATAAVDADDPHTAAVLLYQAAEEIGKAKLLRDHLVTAMPLASSQLRDHVEKFRLALTVVPPNCLDLWGAAFDPNVFDPAIFQTEPVKVDWQRRQASLYANWDEARGEWLVAPTPELEVVRRSAARMADFIDDALVTGLP